MTTAKRLNKPQNLRSDQIVNLLAGRHTNDVFVPECKDGPSQASAHFRMDAWAMNRSWVNALVTAYEVKVSRSDFLGDTKWHVYRNYCNELYFACPAGLIAPDELPFDIGLIYASPGASRVFIKKRAMRRDVEIPAEIFMYILMCRAKIVRHYEVSGCGSMNREYWQAWLADKGASRLLGQSVSKALHQRVETKITEVETENKRLKGLMQAYDGIRYAITAAGLDPDSRWDINERFAKRLNEAQSIFPPNFEYSLDRAIDTIESIKKAAEAMRITPDPLPRVAKEKA